MPQFAPNTDVARVLDTLRQNCEADHSDIVVEGRLLPERDLTNVLRVGRRVVRQALDILEGEGVIVRRQGHGTFLRKIAERLDSTSNLAIRTSPAEILEARGGIEPILARLAAMRATPLMIERMKQLVERGKRARSGREYEKWDTELHAEIARASNNHLYFALFNMIVAVRAEQGWSSLRDSTFSATTRDVLVLHHTAIVDAIATRDSDRAEAAMRSHLTQVANLFGV